jgi:hypothetical protein
MVSELKPKPDIMSESTSEEIDKNLPIHTIGLIFDGNIQENQSLEGITRISSTDLFISVTITVT